MAEVLVGGGKRARLKPDTVLRMLTWFAVIFMCAGLIDTGLAVIPLTPSSASWRFSTGAGVIAGLPILVLGLTIFAMASAGLGRATALAAATTLAGLLFVVVVLLVGFVVSALPEMLAAAPAADPLALKKGALRAVILALLYGSVVAIVCGFGVKHLRRTVAS